MTRRDTGDTQDTKDTKGARAAGAAPGPEPVSGFPRRIVCLTEETTETLYLLGEGERVAGISAYTKRPPEARRKPVVSAFVKAHYDRILALEPDLVLAFSDLQAEITLELVRRGATVFTFNQRTVRQILETILTIARIAGAERRGEALVAELRARLDAVRASASRLPRRPRVFFEEWNDPLISGIPWVEELVEHAGGVPIFPELRGAGLARERIVSPAEVAARDPEVVIASWCGERADKAAIRARPGWSEVAAVRQGRIYEVDSTLILQPGPAALTEGLLQLHAIIAHAAGGAPAGGLAPAEPLDPDLAAGSP